jgi:hypothetical protein
MRHAWETQRLQTDGKELRNIKWQNGIDRMIKIVNGKIKTRHTMKRINFILLPFLLFIISCNQQSNQKGGNIMTTTTDISHVLDQYHKAVSAILGGNAQPFKLMFSHREDVTLATPFGPAILGWKKVSEGIDYHATRFKEGKQISTEMIAKYESPELITILEMEHSQVKVGGREEISLIDLRVTTTFRLEDGEWKLVSRHADPITTFNPDGPLRGDK